MSNTPKRPSELERGNGNAWAWQNYAVNLEADRDAQKARAEKAEADKSTLADLLAESMSREVEAGKAYASLTEENDRLHEASFLPGLREALEIAKRVKLPDFAGVEVVESWKNCATDIAAGIQEKINEQG